MSRENEFRASMMLDALRKSNENLVVNGEYVVMDMTGYTTKHFSRMSMDSNKESFKIYQVGNYSLYSIRVVFLCIGPLIVLMTGHYYLVSYIVSYTLIQVHIYAST